MLSITKEAEKDRKRIVLEAPYKSLEEHAVDLNVPSSWEFVTSDHESDDIYGYWLEPEEEAVQRKRGYIEFAGEAK